MEYVPATQQGVPPQLIEPPATVTPLKFPVVELTASS